MDNGLEPRIQLRQEIRNDCLTTEPPYEVPLAAKGLLERGLMRLGPAPWPPRLFFDEAGLAALRAMMADRRFADPKTFAHVRQELGIDRSPEET